MIETMADQIDAAAPLNRMHIKLFRALKAANLSDDAAAEVVEAIEEYIAVKVQEANKGIESKLTAQTWVIGSVGFVLAVIGLGARFHQTVPVRQREALASLFCRTARLSGDAN
ncbi:hypothetical protein [Rhizorhabdus dicambivorans]|uniref:hypothetical protein n=1 Tax=Rhizorhabdus dicambivorans TaxID=1850238 RepID=UPI001EDFE008|nr:hypothetical protein [Rhizorhabdus dicambivorans]